MSAAEKFLHDFQSRPLSPLVTGLKPKKLILGKGHQPLEVAVLTSDNEPNISTLKDVQKKRKNHRASPVLLTVIHGDNQAFLCGPSGDHPPIHENIKLKLVEKFCRTALKEHFKRLNKLHDREAEKEFFNFFTADIARF